MDILNVYSISGLFYELYYPNVQMCSCESLDFSSENPLSQLNNLFWAKMLSRDNVEHLLNIMEEKNPEITDIGGIERAVLSNKSLFTELVCKAPLELINQGNSEEEMFSYMEQIEIACKLFSKYMFAPFSITIQDGFQEPNLSSKVLVENMLDQSQNPYLQFLEENVFPYLGKIQPRMIWINGQPKLSSLAIAAYVKKLNNEVFVGIRYHSSEYFSLNKIDDLLINNYSLFSIVDCIVLDDSRETCTQVEQVVCKHNGSLHDCRNIIFIDRERNAIIKTAAEKVEYSFDESVNRRTSESIERDGCIKPHEIVNLKLNPNTACYWNKCTFCAINKKYKFLKNKEHESLDEKLDYIEQLKKDGAKYFWFEDEAISPAELSKFADLILQRKLKIIWQVRARIDENFTLTIARKLSSAGLREIRFGLESASARIQRLMNKFPERITLSVIENIVKIFTGCGIHVHFPMIVGFPTETAQERIETYKFLTKLKAKYKRVSYNINVLMLDVASDLFKNFPKYQISTISFPCSPNEYLGNMVNFDCIDTSESRTSIDFKRNEFMRETLYPWMPATAQIKPNIFYRLSETIRNTLIWHSNEVICGIKNNELNIHYEANKLISAWQQEDGGFRLYDWCSHKMFRFSEGDYIRFSAITRLDINAINKSEFNQELLKSKLIVQIKE